MRRIAASVAALALTVSLAACSDNGNAQQGGGSGNGATEAATDLVALAKQVGDQTDESSTAHMEFTGDAGQMKITGEGDMRLGGGEPAMAMDMDTGETGKMSMVLLDGVLYMKLPAELSQGDKPWIKIDSKDKSNPLAQVLSSVVDQMRQNADPRASLEQFQEAGEITSSEQAELNGEQTTHYKITVDVQKLADSQTDKTLKQAMEAAIDSGLKDFPVELWVNGEDLPVRMKIQTPTTDPASGKSVPVNVQVDYSKWGEPVDIQAPPADQVGELPNAPR
jgi:hypothetical protein